MQGKDNKIGHQRNITPNFLRFKRKNTAKNGKGEEEPVESYNPTERSVSRASRSSFDVYQKRILGISNFKNTLNLKSKENSVEPIKKRREGLEVTSRRTNSNKKQSQEETRIINVGSTKNSSINSGSNKNLKIITVSKEKSQKVSNPKRTQKSLQKEQERAIIQNKQFINNLMQKQFQPNYINTLNIKRKMKEQEKKEKIKIVNPNPKKKFFNVEMELKNEEELKNYHIYEELGKGAYGVVKMGIIKKTNQKVAIKIYEKKRLDEPNKIKNLQRQINILCKLDSYVIAKLIDVIQGSQEIFLIQEYGGANSLYNYLLSKPQHRMQESEAKLFFKTIAQTLKYLHEQNIVHRDIKAENILLNRNKELKLIDFGFSLESIPPSTIDTFCGTPTYMAPEIVSKRDHVPIYTDLWSLGVFLYVILQGNYPFRAKNQNQLFQKIRKGQFTYIHEDISQKSRFVIQKLIKVNPLERMSTSQMNESFWEWYLSDSKYSGEVTTNLTTYS